MQYEDIVQDALRGVVKTILEDVKENGLFGNHHLYITFQTNYPGVKMTDYLKERHPEEVTIVLQYQFWDLLVTDVGFSISLSFNDIKENIIVPFGSITGFVDPSVKFGLQFTPKELEDALSPEKLENLPNAEVFLEKKKTGLKTINKKKSTKSNKDIKKKDRSAKVVSIDSFRKKK